MTRETRGIIARVSLRPRAWGPLCILAWAALLRIAAFTGPSEWDDFAYLEFAKDWIDGRYEPSRLNYVYGLRYGIILPVAGSMALFGTAPWAVALPGFIASMLGVWCGMRVGQHVGGTFVGAVTGLALATIPVSARYATKVLPEAFLDLALWAMLAAAFAARVRGSRGLFFVAGLFGGYAYLVRSYGVVLAILGIIPILGPARPSFRGFLPFAAGLAVLPLTEFSYHTLTTGDPLWTVFLQDRVYANLGNLNSSLLFYPKTLFLESGSWFGPMPHLVLLSIPLFWKNACPTWKYGIAVLVLWFAFMQFGVMSWNPIVLLHKESRYLSVLALPFSLVVAATVQRIAERKGSLSRRFLWPVVIVASGWLLFIAIRLPFVAREQRARLHEFRAVAAAIVQGRPTSVAFPHWRWRLRVNYLTGYAAPYWCGSGTRPECPLYEPDANDFPRAGGWVVVDRRPSRNWPASNTDPPRWMTAPPSNWAVQLSLHSVLVVAVPADFDVQPNRVVARPDRHSP